MAVAGSLMLHGCSVLPEPLTVTELAQSAAERLAELQAEQYPVKGPIGLYEAMARAIKFNLDQKVEERERILRSTQLELSRYDMLPKLVSNSGYAARDNFSGSSSLSLLTRTQSLEPSTSAERQIGTQDITFSWHILDFGLSYVRAQQNADKVLMAEENRRKVVHRMIEDVRTAFWRALSAQRLLSQLHSLEREVSSTLSESDRIFDQKKTSPMTALTYKRELIEIQREIEALQGELQIAKVQLAALMNLKPGTRFVLAETRRRYPSLQFRETEKKMILTAFRNRPELREIAYRRRINDKEARAALLELLPGLQIYTGQNWDSNDFLFNTEWVNWGAKASFNAIKLFRYPAHLDELDARDAMLHARAKSVAMAIVTQLFVSRVRYAHASRTLRTARRYYKVQRDIRDQVRAGVEAGDVGKHTLIREKMNTLVARVKLDLAYSEIQNAYANIYAAMGLDPYPLHVTGEEDVRSLTKELKRLWTKRNRRGLRTARK